MLGVTPVLPHIQSGRLKAYAVTSATRIDSLPNVPTMREAGVPGYEATQWYAVAVPSGTPPERLAQLNQWIDLGRGDAGLDVGGDVVQHFRSQAAGHAHGCDVFSALDGDAHARNYPIAPSGVQG